jgi:outer membrane lipoprotein SlyB
VNISPRDTGVGTAGGAVLGAIAGSNVGGGSGQAAGAVGGAILGGIIGNNVERSANEHQGVEVTVLLDSGKYISVVQGADEAFRPGDRVRVLSGRGTTRVTH